MFIDTLKIIGQSQSAANIQSQADSTMNGIVKNELNRQGAEKLGITVTDEEVKKVLEGYNLPKNDAGMALARASLLQEKLITEYFSKLTPESDNQVSMMAMLVESDSLIPELRGRLMNGDNFTMLAGEFAMNSVSIANKGEFGWHPAAVLKDQLGTSIPVDYAFSPEVKAGDISNALADNASYKKLGYWLIKITERTEDELVNTQALLLSSRFEAEYVKSLLESGENLTGLADKYSQYSPSKEKHGDLGFLSSSENVSDAFNGYVFNPQTELGKWSSPIKDTNYWTKGGAWLVQVVGKEENRKLSDDDRNQLVNTAYSSWSSDLWLDSTADIIDSWTDEQKQWATNRAIQELSKITSS